MSSLSLLSGPPCDTHNKVKLLAFVYTQCTFFHQGFEIMKDVEPILKQLHATINKVRFALPYHVDRV